MCDFQRLGVLDQNAVARRHACAGHDRRWGGEPEGARTGNHQHRDCIDQSDFYRGASHQPADHRAYGDHQHGRDEYLADLVHQLLDRRLGSLGVFDQADDARQHCLATQRGGAYQQTPLAIDSAAGDAVAGAFGNRQALATDQRLVGLTFAFDHLAINRETLAGLHQQQVIQPQRSDSDFLFATSHDPHRTIGTQRFERADGGAGLAFGAAL